MKNHSITIGLGNTVHRKRVLMKLTVTALLFLIIAFSGFLIGDEQIEANMSEKISALPSNTFLERIG